MTLCGLFNKQDSSHVSPASSSSRRISRKVLVLGDGACGKTSLLFVLIKHEFPQTYEPTVFENYTHLQSTTSGTPVELTLWDTAGQEEFDKLRSLSYADTHVILLCFSTDNPVSLENVETRWIPEIREYSPGAKIVLVALKCDLRGGNANTLGYQDGVAVAKRIKATRYLECSAKMNRGVNEAFAEIASVAAGVSSDGGRAKMRCVVA